MKFLLMTILTFLTLGISGYGEEAISLDALVAEALRNNPEIKAARAKWQASTKRPSQESALPNPEIGASYKNVGFDRITLGEDDFTEFQIYASQEFPFPGKLKLRGEIAEREAEAEGESLRTAINRVEAEVKAAYFDLFLSRKSYQIASKNKSRLESFAEIAQANYEAGLVPQQDLIKAQLKISASVETLETLGREGDIASARLNALLNRSPSAAPIAVPDELPASPLDYTQDELFNIAEAGSPEIARKKNTAKAAEALLKLRERGYFPDVVIELSWFNRGDFTDEWSAKVGFIAPVYFWRKERAGVSEATSLLDEAREEIRDATRSAEFTIRENYAVLKSAKRLLSLYAKGIVPQARLSVESALAAYGAGKADFGTLADASADLLDFELEYWRKLVEHEKAVSRLEEIAGEEFTQSGDRHENE